MQLFQFAVTDMLLGSENVEGWVLASVLALFLWGLSRCCRPWPCIGGGITMLDCRDPSIASP